MMAFVKVKGQSRSNVGNNVLLLPTLARRIPKQLKDGDDEVIKVEGQQRSKLR